MLNDLVYYSSSGEYESPRSESELRLRPGVLQVLADAQDSGWRLVVVSNQPSHAKGKTSLEALQQVHQTMLTILEEHGIRLTASYYCFHHPSGRVSGFSGSCDCRKPSPHFLFEAQRAHDIDLASSWMIGDQDADVECGERAGCHTALIQYEHSAGKRGRSSPELICSDLPEFLSNIFEEQAEQ